MTENMKNFLAKVSEDEMLVEKTCKLGKDELIALAKELGLELTEADFFAPEGELEEGELNTVAGGYQRCACAVGGGGKEDSQGEACACVISGMGISKLNAETRCFCVAVGTGYDLLRDF